jgi:acetyl esterase/lipase
MDIYEPLLSGEPTTIVLTHAINGRKEDLTQFAFALAANGLRVCNINWRGQGLLADCRNLAGTVRSVRNARQVVLVTWADSSLLGAQVALDPINALDAFVGLAGYYGWPDVEAPPEVVNRATIALIGAHPTADPASWKVINPYANYSSAALPITLVVGDRDPLRRDAESFSARLGGVKVVTVPNCGHAELVIPRLPAGRQAIRAVLAALPAEPR